jgi:general secretion pathway protein C
MMKINYNYIIYPVAAGVFIAWTVTGFLQYRTVASVSINRENSGAQLNVNNEPNTEFIVEKNIFKADVASVKGTLDAVGFEPSVNPDGAQPAAQAANGLKLVGVLKGSGESFAIIKKPDGSNLVLRQNVEKDGITLVSAGETEVEIEQNGVRSKLMLDIKDPMAGQNQQTGASSASTNPNGVDRRTIPRRTVVEKLSNINSVMKSVAINPYERNSKFVGYRLSRMKPDSALAQMGLISGDVIIRLNGKDLKNPTVFFDTLSNAENLSALTLDIERAMQKKTIYVEIKG